MGDEPAGDWTDDEPGLLRLRRELSRLKRRAIARPLRTLGLAAALAGAVVLSQARKSPVYSATIVISVEQGRSAGAATPAPKRELRSYISQVSFNKKNLQHVIEEYDLYSSLYDLDPNLAVESMWDDLDVDVYQNYFLEESWEDTPRSARVAITYRAADPELAFAVARELGTVMIDFEAEKRRQEVASAAEGLDTALDQAEQRLDEVAAALAQKKLAYERLPKREQGALEVEIGRLQRELKNGQARQEELQRARTDLQLAKAAEDERRGLRFRLVDEKKPQTQGRGLLFFIALGAATFFLALPLAVVAVGAFDSRIYDGADVARLGVPVIGQVPSFGGDGIGGLSQRRRAGPADRPGSPG